MVATVGYTDKWTILSDIDSQDWEISVSQSFTQEERGSQHQHAMVESMAEIAAREGREFKVRS